MAPGFSNAGMPAVRMRVTTMALHHINCINSFALMTLMDLQKEAETEPRSCFPRSSMLEVFSAGCEIRHTRLSRHLHM